jgi:outer membrane autotransporter protein
LPLLSRCPDSRRRRKTPPDDSAAVVFGPIRLNVARVDEKFSSPFLGDNPMHIPLCPERWMLRAFAVAAGLLLASGVAQADDVNITADTPNVDLDTFAGATAHIASGVTVGPDSPAISATTHAWSLTNEGAVDGGNTVTLDEGGTFLNESGATVTGTATALTFGYKPFALPPAGGPGTLENYGTIIGGVEGVTIWLGGTVNNYAGGTIQTAAGLNAVSIGQGTSRSLFNAGTIEATSTIGFTTGVLIQGGPSTFKNTATGVIYGDYNGVYGSASAVFTTFDNAGSIASARGPAVEATGGGTLTNSGTIASANADGILIRNSAAAEVVNSGSIAGATNAINFTGGAVGATHIVRLRTGSVLNGNVLGGTATDNLILEGTGSESVAKFFNFETLSMEGSDWTLTNNGIFATSAEVQSGTLRVNGQLTSPILTLDAGGTLAGTGTIIGTVVNNGNLAPGNSIGTLNITGPYTQAGGSTLTVEVNSTGASDLLSVTGAATIQPGATVSVLAAPGTYTVGTRSTILTATGGVGGTYDTLTDNAAFVDFALDYDANNVFLDVLQSTVSFASVTETPNQEAAASGVDSLDTGSAVKTAVFGLTEAQARAAFDRLSGEIYASTKGLLFTQSEGLRNALGDRLLQPGGAGDAPLETSQLTFNFAADASCTPASCALGPGPALTAWARALGSWGNADGDGNAASLSSETAGMLAGADATFDDRWRVGLAAGYSHTGVDADGRASTASIDSYHLGAYGGFHQGPFSVRAGFTYTFHDIDTERREDFPGFSEHVDADSAARSAQVFGELGYDIHLGAATIQPAARLSYVNIDSDRFDEGGGAAALRADSENDDLLFSSLGFRATTATETFGLPLRLHGMLGWRHAYGDTTLESRLRFSDGSAAFTVAGTPIARNAALIEVGADLGITDRFTLGLSYAGQIAPDARENTVRAEARLRF